MSEPITDYWTLKADELAFAEPDFANRAICIELSQAPAANAELARLKLRGEVLARKDAAEDFTPNTCPASRIAASLAEALITGRPYPLLDEEPEYCGEMLAATVAALWELRSQVARGKSEPPVHPPADQSA